MWLKTVAVLVGFGGFTIVALFFSIDYFVTQRFATLHEERIARLTHQIRTAAERERAQLQGATSLIAGDANLINSTYYHRYLDGERDHPQSAVDRIARAFSFASVSLLTPSGQLIARAGTRLDDAPPHSDTGKPRFVLHDGRVWIIASHMLEHNENSLAVLQIANPLAAGGDQLGEEAARSLRAQSSLRHAVDVELDTSASPTIGLRVMIPDTVAEAVAGIKTVLGIMLVTFGTLLTVGLAIALKRVFRPVLDVIDAAIAVGRGDFSRKIATTGGGSEVGYLVEAFNQMSEGLLRLRQVERTMRHQEQLSAIGRAAARVAHDLNNPLTVITTTAGLVARRTDLDPALAADIRLIEHHCERARATIEALLDYGRPVRMRSVRCDLVPAVEDMAMAWKRRHPAVQLDFRASVPAIPAEVDLIQIERMLENVLDNARSVSTRVEVALDNVDGAARISVSDDGPGFSTDAQAHLFEPFFTTQTGGTGLGLASALAIARAHGGDINITPGPPAIVAITLPLASASAQPKP
ncbi:MAG: ATP-binding protein [Hyphomicrobiaceae bacterium]